MSETSDSFAPWIAAAERVRALAAEHGTPEAMIAALGLPGGLGEFAEVYGRDRGVEPKIAALLVAMGAVLAREKAAES